MTPVEAVSRLEKGDLVCRVVTQEPLYILGGRTLTTDRGISCYERAFGIQEFSDVVSTMFRATVSGWEGFRDEEFAFTTLDAATRVILRIYRERAFLSLASLFETDDALVTIILRRGFDDGKGPFTAQLHAFVERAVSTDPSLGILSGGRHLNVPARSLEDAIDKLTRKP